jgi:superfamily II DNA/RNA helicase
MAAGPTSAGTWDGLGLTPAVLDIVKTKLNFQTMTPVQAHAIPPFLKYKDVAVEVRSLRNCNSLQ